MPPRAGLPSPKVGRLSSRLLDPISKPAAWPRRNASTSTSSSSPSSPSTATSSASGKAPRRKVIFSGIQPTGVPHLGNYLGALRSWVRLQEEAWSSPSVEGGRQPQQQQQQEEEGREDDGRQGEPPLLLYSVVDLHALTVPQDAKVLRRQRREMLAALLAVGLDPRRSTVFYQSSVPAHTELMWLLSCTASMGYLSRMTQWKSKLSLTDDTGALDENAKAALKLGLFSYPVLQAADIMVHRTTHVPVGDDQKQHIEFARECASSFNAIYKSSAVVPPEIILSPARRVMSLTHPTNKMSKSDPNPASRVLLTDDPDQIRKKIGRALTDSDVNNVTYDPAARPGVANLLEILSILQGGGGGGGDVGPAELARDYEGVQRPLRALKERTADAVVREFGDVRERYRELLERRDGAWLDEIEAIGAKKARANADVTIRRVKEAVGL